MAKRRKKIDMSKFNYKGYEIHEVTNGEYRVSFGSRGYYMGSDNSLSKAKEHVDRIIESYNFKSKKQEE